VGEGGKEAGGEEFRNKERQGGRERKETSKE